jgi:6-phosphogluconolactonase/glucosamine-6-phosphate isomerase/deaminase
MSISANKLFQAFKKSEEKNQFTDAAEQTSANFTDAENSDKTQAATNEPKKHSCCGGCGGDGH